MYFGALASSAPGHMHAGFAYEIQTPLGGRGMEGLLSSRQYKLNGVLNGIDDTVWNPETDPELAENYTAEDLTGKAWCKVRPLHASCTSYVLLL